MSWDIKYLPEAQEDLQKLDNSVRPQIMKGINKVSRDPTPGGYGKPLGNCGDSNLTRLYKIVFSKAGIRVVYALRQTEQQMIIVVISVRSEEAVYKEAQMRKAQLTR
jgi:mRNA interferase RelE/StbE